MLMFMVAGFTPAGLGEADLFGLNKLLFRSRSKTAFIFSPWFLRSSANSSLTRFAVTVACFVVMNQWLTSLTRSSRRARCHGTDCFPVLPFTNAIRLSFSSGLGLKFPSWRSWRLSPEFRCRIFLREGEAKALKQKAPGA